MDRRNFLKVLGVGGVLPFVKHEAPQEVQPQAIEPIAGLRHIPSWEGRGDA